MVQLDTISNLWNLAHYRILGTLAESQTFENRSFENTGRLRWNLDGKHGISGLEEWIYGSAGQFMIGPGWA